MGEAITDLPESCLID